MVSDLDSESRLALHIKREKVKLTFLIVSLEKRDFVQMAANISNIYIYISYRSSQRDELICTSFEFGRRPRREKWPFEVTN